MSTEKYYEYVLPDGRIWVIHNHIIKGADPEVAAWVSLKMGESPVETKVVALGVLRPDCQPTEVREENLKDLLISGTYYFNEKCVEQLKVDGTIDYQAGIDQQGPSDIMACVYSDNVVAGHPDTVREILHYPFGTRKHRRITVEIDESNQHSLNQAIRMGFKEEGLKEGAGIAGGDIFILGLKRDECEHWSSQQQVAA